MVDKKIAAQNITYVVMVILARVGEPELVDECLIALEIKPKQLWSYQMSVYELIVFYSAFQP